LQAPEKEDWEVSEPAALLSIQVRGVKEDLDVLAANITSKLDDLVADAMLSKEQSTGLKVQNSRLLLEVNTMFKPKSDIRAPFGSFATPLHCVRFVFPLMMPHAGQTRLKSDVACETRSAGGALGHGQQQREAAAIHEIENHRHRVCQEKGEDR
jgi:hypothetical protein